MRAPLPVTVTAFALTAFYTVHDKLPPSLRAPGSLLIAPVKFTAWIARELGFSGNVYDSLPVIFAVNWLGCFLVSILLGVFARPKR